MSRLVGPGDPNAEAVVVELEHGRRVTITALYHLVHVDNLQSILRHGLLSHRQLGQQYQTHKSIAYSSVQALRERIWIELKPPPQPVRLNLHEFVPFYFVPRMPMLYARTSLQDDLVFVEVTPDLLRRSGTLFSDGNASVQGLSSKYPEISVRVRVSTGGETCDRGFGGDRGEIPSWQARGSVSQIYSGQNNLKLLNWDLLLALSWAATPDGRRMRCAEVLVHDSVSAVDFRKVVVRIDTLLDRVQTFLAEAAPGLPAECHPENYFDIRDNATAQSSSGNADVDPDGIPF